MDGFLCETSFSSDASDLVVDNAPYTSLCLLALKKLSYSLVLCLVRNICFSLFEGLERTLAYNKHIVIGHALIL